MTSAQDSISISIKQKTFNYERSLIQSPLESLSHSVSSHQAKYTICDLNTKIQQITKNQPHNLRWIGNGQNSSIQSYFYCVLMLSVSDSKTFLMFKNSFYQLCRKYLNLQQQRYLVDFLCLLEFSNDKYLFLKKYPAVQNTILKVLNSILKEKKLQKISFQKDNFDPYFSFNKFSRKQIIDKENFLTENSLQIKKLTQIYEQLTKNFAFIQFQRLNQYSIQLRTLNNQKMFVILQKQYFFTLQVLKENKLVSKKSKLTKGDLDKVQKLLCRNENKTSINPQQEKQILNIKMFKQNFTENCVSLKKDFKPSFLSLKSLPNKSKTFHHGSLKLEYHNNQQYIDLMESSFQQSKKSHQQNFQEIQLQNSLQFYEPKTFAKKMFTPSFLNSKKKNTFQQSQESNHFKRTRSPSELNKNYFTMVNNQDKQRNCYKKQFRFNSPLKSIQQFRLKQKRSSPQKILLNKQVNSNQKLPKSSNVYFEKQKTRGIQKKIENQKQQIKNITFNGEKKGRSLQKKTSFFTPFSPKVFNNRISLQSRQDLAIFTKPKGQQGQAILKGIPEADQKQQLSGRDLFQKKKMIRQELSQSLNDESQSQLKRKIFQHFQAKQKEHKFIWKRNKSLQQKDTQPSQQMIPPLDIKFQLKQCPQTVDQCYDGYKIRIILTDKTETQEIK